MLFGKEIQLPTATVVFGCRLGKTLPRKYYIIKLKRERGGSSPEGLSTFTKRQ